MIRPDRIGHVVIKVRDLERSKRFYREVLGLDLMGELATPRISFLAANRNDHHEIGLLEVGPEAPDASPAAVGLVHIAFRLKNDDELVAAYRELKERGVRIHFTVDHGVTKSVYFFDPDGNELEVYSDNSPEEIAAFENAYAGMEKLGFAPEEPGLGEIFQKRT
jgi:catechol 2,3-dioxygenase